MISQVALAHPGSGQVTHEQQAVLDCPPPHHAGAVATIWGAEISRQIIPIEDREGSVLLSGLCLPQTWSRASRDAQYYL